VADGFAYYVRPFVRGESLRARLEREKQLGIDEALDIARQVISALDYAHRHGIVHRDIKPENILIHEGEAVLSDFGIATAVKEAGGSRLTESGVSLGTPQYMSPEQATGDRVLDARSDVYRILLARDAPRGGAHASQFSLIPRAGGAESQIPVVVENLVDFHWSPDGTRMMYLHGGGGNEVLLVERDTTGSARREIARLQQSEARAFHPLPNGAICILPPDRRSMSIIRRPGQRPVRWQFPDWLKEVGSMSHSPDAKSLVVEGVNPRSDTVVVATVDIETGRFTRMASFAGSDPQQIAWLQNGSITSVFREREGAWVFHRIRARQPAERLGTLPHTRAGFSISNDGKHVAMFSYRDRNDVYMIRNFGEMLRR